MAGPKGKKTKEDFTSFLLGDDLDTSIDKTSLLPQKKSSEKSGEQSNEKLPENSQLQRISKDLPSLGSKKAVETQPEDSARQAPLTQTEEAVTDDKTWKSDVQKVESKSSVKVLPKTEVLSTPVSEVHVSEITKSSPRIEFAKKSLSEVLDPSLISVEAALKQSEFLKLAQDRIQHLETKMNEVVSENETLASSGLVMQKKYDEMYSKYDQLLQLMKAEKESFKDEMSLKERVIQEIQRERDELKKKNEEFSSIMKEKIQQVRVRERELMNRLEILQLEEDAVISNKDEIILDLKKHIDRLNYEIENYKAQGREMNQEIQSQKEQMRKTIKALKVSLNILEHEEALEEFKKTGT